VRKLSNRFSWSIIYSVYFSFRLLLSLIIGEENAYKNPDTADYVEFGSNFFAVLIDNNQNFNELGLRRTPGYPLLLAIFGAENWIYLIVVHNLMIIGTSLLIKQVLVAMDFKKYSSLGALIPLLDPAVLIESTYILTEIMLMFSLMTAIWLAYSKMSIYCMNLSMTFVLILLPIIKPIAIFFIPFLLWHFFSIRPQSIWRFLTVSLPVIATLFLYTIKNWIIYDVLRISSIDSINILYYEGALLESMEKGKSLEDVQNLLALKELNLVNQGASVRELVEFRNSEGISLIFENISQLPEARLYGAVKVLLGPGKASIESWLQSTPTFLITVIVGIAVSYLLLQTTLLMLGLLGGLRTDWQKALPLSCLFAMALLLSSGANAYSRFRVPLVPLIAIFVTLGLSYSLTAIQRKRIERG
jgi:hypothetical protein